MTPSQSTSQIEMRDQPRLTTGRIAGITLPGIRYRLFRSLVTIVVIAVAVAFLIFRMTRWRGPCCNPASC